MEPQENHHGGIEGRLCWFEAYAPNYPLYHKVAKPLLSMRTTGSLDIEHNILTKKHNRLADDKAITLIRASENLKASHENQD